MPLEGDAQLLAEIEVLRAQVTTLASQTSEYARKLENLGIMMGGFARDFSTLLMGVLGNANLALLDLPPGEVARERIEEIKKAAMRAAELANQIVAHSGKVGLVVEELDLNDLIRNMDQLLQTSIAKTAVLRYQLGESLPSIEADAAQVRQIVLNLIINASEALGDRSGVITLRSGAVRADRPLPDGTYPNGSLPKGSYVSLEVADTGCGMDATTQARVFDPFFTTKGPGRGLGLPAVLGIVRGHRGSLKIASQVGEGTTVTVLFRCVEPSQSPPTPGAGVVRPAQRSGQTILVVEDAEPARNVAAAMLETTGFSVLTAADGVEGVEVFRAHSNEIAAVLLDMTMPRMSGEEAFREMRRIRSDVPVILVSGYTEQDAIARFAAEGLAGFIQKPFHLRTLTGTLQEVLGGQQEGAEGSSNR